MTDISAAPAGPRPARMARAEQAVIAQYLRDQSTSTPAVRTAVATPAASAEPRPAAPAAGRGEARRCRMARTPAFGRSRSRAARIPA